MFVLFFHILILHNYHTNYLHPIIVSPQKIVILSLLLYHQFLLSKSGKSEKFEVPNPVVALSVG